MRGRRVDETAVSPARRWRGEIRNRPARLLYPQRALGACAPASPAPATRIDNIFRVRSSLKSSTNKTVFDDYTSIQHMRRTNSRVLARSTTNSRTHRAALRLESEICRAARRRRSTVASRASERTHARAEREMAWGKSPAGVASWVEKLKANDPSLTSVTVFRGRLFGAAEASEVCAALRTNTHLAELYASGHPMDASTAACFADMLATNATLRSLCVGDDAFGDAGLAALAPGVARSASLAALDLENKGVGDAGGEALGAALATASLSELILSRNPALGSRGVAAVCAGAAAGGRLAALRLAELALDGDAPAALAALLASPCPLTILDLDRVRAFVDADGPTKLREGLARRRARAPLRSMPSPSTASSSETPAPSRSPAAMSPPSPPRPPRFPCVRCLCVGVAWAPPARARSPPPSRPPRRFDWERIPSGTTGRFRWRRRSRTRRRSRRWT